MPKHAQFEPEAFFVLCLWIKNNTHDITHFTCRAGLLRLLVRGTARYSGRLFFSILPSF